MKNVNDYKILTATNVDDLANAVNFERGQGWVPLAGVSVTGIWNGKSIKYLFAQSVVIHLSHKTLEESSHS